jgi:hypothetical protein
MKVKNHFAIIRNLRNIIDAGVSDYHINKLKKCFSHDSWELSKILPFRYVAAARACPSMEREIDAILLKSIDNLPKLTGKTVVLVDVSSSMDERLSGKSDLTRLDAACALASIINAEDLRVFSFSDSLVEVPPRKGMSGIDAINKSQYHRGTRLGQALNTLHVNVQYDTIIIITDEQTAGRIPDPLCKNAYMINVASYKNGIGYGKWIHIDGFSENVIKWIYEHESNNL